MTERCADFICTLALETSCEGCARICHTLGIKVSGDTVIRLLLKRYDSFPAPEAGDVIGVDDFAYKKRHTYGTIIVDGKTHEPVILLDGRNGDTLREWLKHNYQGCYTRQGKCICKSNCGGIAGCNAGCRQISPAPKSSGGNQKSFKS